MKISAFIATITGLALVSCNEKQAESTETDQSPDTEVKGSGPVPASEIKGSGPTPPAEVKGSGTTEMKGSGTKPAPESSSETPKETSAAPSFDREAAIAKLTPIQKKVALEDGTEPAFNNAYWDNKKDGIYVDILSGEPLFSSTDKFKSGTGWPSFTKPIDKDEIVEKTDYKIGYPRTEVRGKTGDTHLGHVFSDGPQPTGLRYCINSAALKFVPKEQMEEAGYGDLLNLFSE